MKRSFGYLTPAGLQGYARAKAVANARVRVPKRGNPAGGPIVPVPGPTWSGEFQTDITPPDPTGAVGPKRYIELVNQRYGIYDKGGVLISDGTLGTLTGHSMSCIADPQILWDTSQSRFYYTVLDFCANTIAWGYSKADAPSTNLDFCSYTADFGYGTNLPDYPRLGDTRDFLLIGVNVFAGGITYTGSDVAWINKSGATGLCPPASTFGLGTFASLKLCDKSLAFTPVPAVMTDVTPNGFVLATQDVSGGGTGSVIAVYGVRPNPLNPAVPQLSPSHCVTVSNYTIPADAQQCSSTKLLDTLDGRLKQAVMGKDPAHLNQFGVWTSHAVFGGAGAEERWYEIKPLPLTTPSLWQSGTATDATLYVWNGAIAPDRAVNGGSIAFGQSMVLGFNTSSHVSCPSIQMVSKIGPGVQSAFVLVHPSLGPNEDFSCGSGVCRWGDFSGASADPTPPAGSTGKVWLSGEWNVPSLTPTDVDWRSWNWGALP